VDALGELGRSDAVQYREQMHQDENDVVRDAAPEWLAELKGAQTASLRRIRNAICV
jgi:hypothetical protein